MVTGVGPFSLGERIVVEILTARPGTNILGIDITPNPRLARLHAYHELIIDLNPLHNLEGLRAFAANISIQLERCLEDLGASSIEVLIQSAGTYDSGSFLECDTRKREQVLGVNLFGHIEVLHAVMGLNSRRGFSNPAHLTYLDVGSFHGLHARKDRSLYAVSKAAVIDMCTALVEGDELLRCFYLAPCPIDTHMLHKNHWVQKAGGSLEFFEAVFRESFVTYEGIFRACDQHQLRRFICNTGHNQDEVLAAFATYVAERRAAYSGPLGVLSPEACAEVVATLVFREQPFASGVYFVSLAAGGRPSVQYAAFGDLTRRESLTRIGSRVNVIAGEA